MTFEFAFSAGTLDIITTFFAISLADTSVWFLFIIYLDLKFFYKDDDLLLKCLKSKLVTVL